MGLFSALAVFACVACVGSDPTTSPPGGSDATNDKDATSAASDARQGPDSGAGSNAAPGPPGSVKASAVAVTRTVSTLAGQATGGFAEGTGEAAKFSEPSGVAVDTLGTVYVADKANHRIRKISPAGVVTTFAGTGATAFAEGNPGTATFFLPIGIAIHTSGFVYVADSGNNRIRKVTPSGIVATLAGSATGDWADGNGASAKFFGPSGIAVDSASNVYVGDTINQRIRIVTPAGDVTTIAGSGAADFINGTGAGAAFKYPSGVAVANGTVVVCDASNERIRKVTSAGQASTLAGSGAFTPFADGIGVAATFNSPQGVALDTDGNAYVADQNFHRIRKVTPAGVVTTFAGSGQGAFADGPAESAAFKSPYGVAVDSALNVYVADTYNNRIRKVVSVGIRELAVKWNAPSNVGSSPITGYEATATAAGQAPQTCTSTGALTCSMRALASGVSYAVTVTASNSAGTSDASAPSSATPN